jgi:hypothetical protein
MRPKRCAVTSTAVAAVPRHGPRMWRPSQSSICRTSRSPAMRSRQFLSGSRLRRRRSPLHHHGPRLRLRRRQIDRRLWQRRQLPWPLRKLRLRRLPRHLRLRLRRPRPRPGVWFRSRVRQRRPIPLLRSPAVLFRGQLSRGLRRSRRQQRPLCRARSRLLRSPLLHRRKLPLLRRRHRRSWSLWFRSPLLRRLRLQ